jgi:uncharacterized protein (TIGR00251 family)
MADGQSAARPGRVLQQTADGVLLRVRVQPRANVTQVEGVHGEQLRLRVAAPPLAGAANAACIVLLAKTFGIRRAQVRLHTGAKSRDKLFCITGLTLAEVAAVLGLIQT